MIRPTAPGSRTDVDIVLPCYNAAAWIDRFVNALHSVEVPWRLVTRDDGSADESALILLRWKQQLGDRMLLLTEPPGNVGVIASYDALLAATSARWILTADPDDFWLPNHLPLVLAALAEAEDDAGSDVPIAVATDAVVVDDERNVIAPSFWKWSHVAPPDPVRLHRLAMESPALGSTMAMNRALIDAARPIPNGAAYQDWWLVLVAAAFGRFVTVREATIHYRRHARNTTADPFAESIAGAVTRVMTAPSSARDRARFLIRQAARQAAAFVERFGTQLPDRDCAALRALVQLPEAGPLARRSLLVRHDLWFTSRAKNLALLLVA